MPVRKGEQFQVAISSGQGTGSMTFFPVGS